MMSDNEKEHVLNNFHGKTPRPDIVITNQIHRTDKVNVENGRVAKPVSKLKTIDSIFYDFYV